MPHKIRNCTDTVISKASDVNKALDVWDLILSWCLMADQQDTKGTSLLALSVDVVAEGNDAYFGCWIDNRLDLTLKPCPTSAAMEAVPPGDTQPLDLT